MHFFSSFYLIPKMNPNQFENVETKRMQSSFNDKLYYLFFAEKEENGTLNF